MSPRSRSLCRLHAGLTFAAIVAATAAGAQPAVSAAAASAPAKAESARAVERCEASVVETLRKLRGKVEQVQFIAAQRAVDPGDDGDLAVKGAGRYRSGASRPFTYGCNYDVRTGTASGVVLRESGGAAGGAWQPDLSVVSPEACESAVARLLKDKHPRVAQITLDPSTRRLDPGLDADRAIVLSGHGALQRAPGMNAVPFSYECALDARSGRVVGVKTSV